METTIPETGAAVAWSTMGRKPATYEDLEALPEHVVGELIGGKLYASPRPAVRHVDVASLLGIELGGAFYRGRGGPGGWRIVDEPELHLGEDVLVPDLAGWRRERMPVFPRAAALSVAPDWLCEVLSPSTEARDRAVKLPVYADKGVRHVWLVDPDVHTLEVFRLEGSRYVLLGTYTGDARVHAEPFEVFELELGVLWGD
jgi:Uma2 family endonuclease